LKPFSSVQSRNFNTLLVFSRITAAFSLLLLIIGVGITLWASFTESLSNTIAVLPIIVWSILLFLFAGIIAVLVSIEEHLRMQEVRDVRNGKI
jgi:hypothetical protein